MAPFINERSGIYGIKYENRQMNSSQTWMNSNNQIVTLHEIYLNYVDAYMASMRGQCRLHGPLIKRLDNDPIMLNNSRNVETYRGTHNHSERRDEFSSNEIPPFSSGIDDIFRRRILTLNFEAEHLGNVSENFHENSHNSDSNSESESDEMPPLINIHDLIHENPHNSESESESESEYSYSDSDENPHNSESYSNSESESDEIPPEIIALENSRWDIVEYYESYPPRFYFPLDE